MEEAPIMITRRYQANFAQHAKLSSPVAASSAATRSLLIDTDSETSEAEDGPKMRASGSLSAAGVPKTPIQKAQSAAGIVKSRKPPGSKQDSTTTPQSSKNSALSTRSSFETKKRKSTGAKVEEEEDELGTPIQKVAKQRPSSAGNSADKKKSATTRYSDILSDDEDDISFSQARASNKPLAGTSAHASTWSSKSSAKSEETSAPKPKKEKRIPAATKVYLSQASEPDKEYYARRLRGIMEVEPDVRKATHVVSFKRSMEEDEGISFSVVYAIALGIPLMTQKWLDDAVFFRKVPDIQDNTRKDIPGSYLLTEMHQARALYLIRTSQLHPSEFDTDLPPLLFSQWTFNIDIIKRHWSETNVKLLKEIILANGGLISGEFSSDIWLTISALDSVPALHYGEPAAPPHEDLMLKSQHPDWRKRKFKNNDTVRDFPTYAIPIDFIKESVIKGVCADPRNYRNLLQELHGL